MARLFNSYLLVLCVVTILLSTATWVTAQSCSNADSSISIAAKPTFSQTVRRILVTLFDKKYKKLTRQML